MTTLRPRIRASLTLFLAALFLALAPGYVSFPAYAVEGSVKGELKKLRRIERFVSAVKPKPYPATSQNPVCMEIYKAIEKRGNVSTVQPLLVVKEKSNRLLTKALKNCPITRLNKNYALRVPRQHHFTLMSGPPWASPKFYEDEVYGTKGFQLYRIDFDHNPANGKETLYYEEGLVGRDKYKGGIFKIIDLTNCTVQNSVMVKDMHSDDVFRNPDSGILKINGRYYVYDFESINNDSNIPVEGTLRLYNYQSDQSFGGRQLVTFAPSCVFSG